MISVGIDVSKGKSMVCIMKPGGEVLKTPFEMQHTMKEVLSLVTLIKSYDEEVRVILESTGYYHLPIVTVLYEKGIFVSNLCDLQHLYLTFYLIFISFYYRAGLSTFHKFMSKLD